MILKNGKTISTLYKGSKVINKIYKGTLTIYEGFKKLMVSGVPPLILTNSIGQDLVDYKIYGNSVQDGEPMPTIPIEIESVGERTKNLVDKLYNGYADITSFPELSAGGSLVFQTIKLKNVKAGTYTFSFERPVNIARSMSTSSHSSNLSIKPNYSSSTQIATIILEQDEEEYQLSFRDSVSNNVQWNDGWVQCEYGDTQTEYEPYGYKIPVKVSGKNLLPNEWKDYSNWKLYGENNTSPYVSYLVKVKPNTTYTISKRNNYIPTTQDNVMNLIINAKKYTASGASSTDKWLILPNSVANNNPKSIKITTDDDGVLLLTTYNGSNEKIENLIKVCGEIQIEEGSVETEYEPYVEPITTNIYLDEPLRKIVSSTGNGTYQDYIDFENKKVVRNIMQKRVSSSDTWNIYDGNKYGHKCYQSLYTEDSIRSYGHSMCNTFRFYATAWASGNLYDYSDHPTTNRYYFVTDISTMEEWKEWLDNNELIIDFILLNPTEETIELPNIPTLKGTCVLSLDTKIQASNMEVIYKGK